MKIKVGIIDSEILTDNADLLKALVKLYSFPDPKAAYVPAYSRGFWDGKKRFMTPKGKFKSGLLPRILEDLAKIECYPDLEYTYSPEPDKGFDYHIKDWEYRDYQSRYIYEALSRKRCVISATTGSGKTLILAGLIKALKGRKIVVLFNQKGLIHQTYEYLTQPAPKGVGLPENDGISVGVAFGDGFQYGDVMLTSVFSLHKILGTPHENADVLMVDEIHEFCTGKLTSAAIGSFGNAEYRFGFSGTPPKEDIKLFTMEGAIGPVIKEVSTSSLIEAGTIARPDIQIIPIDYPTVDDGDMNYLDVYDEFIVRNKTRNRAIKDVCDKVAKDGSKILILVKNLEHAATLHALIPGSYKLEGEDSIPKRQSEVQRFLDQASGSVLIGTRIFQTGINIPQITHFINARGLKAESATLQALGRTMRVYKENDIVYVYDFKDNVKYLKRHANSRIRSYKGEGHKVTMLPSITYED